MKTLPATLSLFHRGLAAVACVAITGLVFGSNLDIAQRYAEAGARSQREAGTSQEGRFSAVHQTAPAAGDQARASAPCRPV